ncbi:MAG: hypothetical protein K2X77_24520 [Candidatus Obscuribacterales bacterium]|jgi:hypothetical protein|nr:hypothetical protein [Candidatus Obscuribacterales bacterium]
MAKKEKHPLCVVPGQDLHPAHLERVIRASKAYTEEVNRSRIVYPDPNSIDFEGEDAEFQVNPAGFISNALGLAQRAMRGKGKGGGGGNKQPKLPNPQTVLTEIRKYYQGLPPVGMKGNLVLGEFNAEFGDSSKARYFKDSYIEIASHVHVLGCIEVDAGWVNEVAGYVGYKAFTSTANTRSQAVGFLVHPRLEVVKGPIEYMQVGTVQGVPDLRPAYRLDLRDKTTGEEFSVTVVHLKSMRGGPQATSAIRYKQLDILQKLLGPNYKGFVFGDMNYILTDKTLTDGDPLLKNGFTMLAPNDKTPTQSMGSRIDGWFFKNLSRQFKLYQVRRFYANPLITRAFGDHAETQGQLVFCEGQYQVGKEPNPGCPGGDDENSLPVDVQPQGVTIPSVLPTFGKDDD